MTRIRTQQEIISSLLDYYRVAQPKLDTKPGSVARDLTIEGVAAQIARLYNELGRIAALQSLRLSLGVDLDRWGSNLGLQRLRGSKATGVAILTFNNLDADLAVTKGTSISARNGATFLVSDSITISSVFANQYKAVAAKYKSDFDFVGITDQYAVEIAVEAAAVGDQGNISKYSLVAPIISGINNAINVAGFGGGRGAEDDTSFRTRILAVFGGANTGTALGYKNAVKADPAVIDAVVIEPGDSLMTRDGTQVSIAEDGTRTIISEGTGGRVDVIVYGVRLQEVIDSFIYHDLSNTDDPTNTKNDFVLGQITEDENKTVTRKRLDNIENGILPSQPVNNIIQVTGSISGGNFVEKSVNELGVVSGNYELIRDDGAFAGSPWGFDRLRWISDRISDFVEDKTKSTFNGQDALGFTDVLEISKATQNITVSNENSKVSASNRSSVQLAHYPITNVTRVFNATTGERYVVTSQNPDGSGSLNETGRITISGKSLPAVSDVLQVDYTWVFEFDPSIDFDNRVTGDNIRTVQDSLDWGFSNNVRREQATLTANGSYLSVTTTHPISSVVSVNVFDSESSTITLSSNRLAVVVTNTVSNVVSITRASDGAEIWKTNNLDGTFSGQTIFLPTDTFGIYQEEVVVVYNAEDVYNADTIGSFSGTKITIVPSTSAVAGTMVECNYVANVNTLLPAVLLPSLPAIRVGNSFSVGNTAIGTQPSTHILDGNGVIISNLRQAPSNLALTISGTVSPGVITVTGTTLVRVAEAVFTVSNTGLKHDLSTAIKSFLGLSSSSAVPSTIKVARVTKVEKVTTSSNFEVLSSDYTYDLRGYEIYDNSYFKEESVANTSLKTTEFVLPSTSGNEDNSLTVGDRLRVTFYYTVSSDTENISFGKSGTLYTNKRFCLVDVIAISSGFTSGSSASATLTVTNLNQPITRSRYKTTYDYLGPKPNERITIKYNMDRLITDATFAIENTRPINADVLAKAATPILVDVIMNITVTEDFTNNTNIVLQNVQDAVTSTLNTQNLALKVDGSDLVNKAYSVNGVDSARIIYFNRTGKTGSVLFVKAQKNEYLRANSVTIELE